MKTAAEHKQDATPFVRYEKDKATKIATITFDRQDKGNTTTIGMRLLFGELVHKANIDDDVKVLVIRARDRISGRAAISMSMATSISTPAQTKTSCPTSK